MTRATGRLGGILLALVLVLAAPGLLTLTPLGYSHLSLAHLAAFVLATLLLVTLGRAWRRHRPRGAAHAGLWAGAATGALGAVGTQALMHTPRATAAFVANLAPRGVPPQAATTLLHLNLVAGVVLTAVGGAALYGGVGFLAAWWGGRSVRRAHSEDGAAGAS